jgi:Ni/Co efflux regulator RcnB
MAMSLTISRRLALAAAATLAAAGAALAQQDGQIVTAQDIARACQRTHRNPQATAEPTTVGRYGIELNCRLINAAGFTLARVAP